MNALGTALSCLLLASLAAGASLTAEARGIANQQNLRITGGTTARKGLLPFQVALFEKDVFFCSGTILSPTWVLTSAKCIDGKTTGIEVRAGLIKLDDTSADVQKVASAEHIVNEHFEPEFLDNDVALIKLATPLTLGTGTNVNSITLPTYADAAKDPAGRDVLISGWGRTADTMTDPSNDLKYAAVTLSANSVCEAAFGNKVIGTKICLDTASSKHSACIGDAGGPVAAADVVTGEKSLIGIVSFGFEDGCQKDTPVVFTRVSSFLGFIGQKTDIVIMDNPPAAE